MGLISLLIAWMWDRKEGGIKDDIGVFSLTRRIKLPSTDREGYGKGRLDAEDL